MYRTQITDLFYSWGNNNKPRATEKNGGYETMEDVRLLVDEANYTGHKLSKWIRYQKDTTMVQRNAVDGK